MQTDRPLAGYGGVSHQRQWRCLVMMLESNVMMRNPDLTIGWWNTSCNPYGGSNSKIIPAENIAVDIKKLVRRCNLVFLGEFMQKSGLDRVIATMCTSNGSYDYKVHDMYDKAGATVFKNILIYDSQKIAEEFVMPRAKCILKPISPQNSRPCRAGQRIELQTNFAEKRFDIYVSHWNALYDEKYARRRRSAQALAQTISAESKGNYVVCIGDYNLEPYEDVLTQDMGTSRSSNFSLRNNCLFNVAWSELGDNKGTLGIEGRKFASPLVAFDQAFVNKEVLDDFDVGFSVLRLHKQMSRGEHNPIILKLKRRSHE